VVEFSVQKKTKTRMDSHSAMQPLFVVAAAVAVVILGVAAPTSAFTFEHNATFVKVTFYPPVGNQVPVIRPDGTLEATLFAPVCKSYIKDDLLSYEIFCRQDTFVAPQSAAEVLPSLPLQADSDAGSPTFAIFECTSLDVERWWLANPAIFNSGLILPNIPNPYVPVCGKSTACYQSPTGLPMSRFDSAAQRANPPNRELPYYCCTERTFSATTNQQLDVDFLHTNQTVCTFIGREADEISSQTDCSGRNLMLQVCNTTVELTDASASGRPSVFRPFLCDYACLFPCATGSEELTSNQCDRLTPLSSEQQQDLDTQRLPSRQDLFLTANGQSECLPEAYVRQCTRNMVQDNPSFCPETGEILHGFLDQEIAANSTDDLAREHVRASCVFGTAGCILECLCSGTAGCPAHSFCNSQGTLFESDAVTGILVRFCRCDAGFIGPHCEYSVNANDCSRGQNCGVEPLVSN
jgi:hypothetical protein